MLTETLVQALYPRASGDHIRAFAAQSDDLFRRFGLAQSDRRRDYLLAQVGHESGGLTIVEENLRYSAERICAVWPSRFPDVQSAQVCARQPEQLANTVYSNRMGNGPKESGDGWRYRGRGYIQLTGRDGYRQVGGIAGMDLENEPDKASEPATALLVACAFWQWKGINALADTGDFEKVTRRINGGTVGMADRRAWLDKVRRILAPAPAQSAAIDSDVLIAVQRALQARGYREVGAADGLLGPRTIAAITRFREQNALGTGLIDEPLKQALGIDA